MNIYADGPYDQDAPVEMVRCLACGTVMEKDWFQIHKAEECLSVEWEGV